MTNPYQQAHALLLYLNQTRGIGHTKVLFKGIRDTPGTTLLLANTTAHAALILKAQGLKPKGTVPGPYSSLVPRTTVPVGLESIGRTLKGHRYPLAVDHSALMVLLQGLVDEIDHLRQKID